MGAQGAEFDLVIAGGGGTGMAAAIEAARAGARVAVVEKGPRLAGTTGTWSVGSYTSSGTPHQARAGVQDSWEAHFEDLGKFNAAARHPDNLALREIFVRAAPGTFRWLLDLGVQFVGPSPEPPHRVPRMHNVLPTSRAFAYHLGRAIAKLPVTVLTDTAVTDLLISGGRVEGVAWRRNDGSAQGELRGRRGVLLAAGDFAGSREFKSRYFGPEVVDAAPVNELATGDGLRLGEAAGGRILNGTHANAPRMRFVPAAPRWMQRLPPIRPVTWTMQTAWNLLPPAIVRPFVMGFLTTVLGPEPRLFERGAILVGTDGERVPVDPKSLALDLVRRPDNTGYIVLDAELAAAFEAWPDFVSTAPGVAYAYMRDYRAGRRDIHAEAPTLEALAARIGVPPARLAATYAAAHGGRPGKPPFTALGPVRGYITITEGGLAVSNRLEVLDAADRPIVGLFAAGSNGQGGMLLEGHGHHVSWAFVSGRLAARAMLDDRLESVTEQRHRSLAGAH